MCACDLDLCARCADSPADPLYVERDETEPYRVGNDATVEADYER